MQAGRLSRDTQDSGTANKPFSVELGGDLVSFVPFFFLNHVAGGCTSQLHEWIIKAPSIAISNANILFANGRDV